VSALTLALSFLVGDALGQPSVLMLVDPAVDWHADSELELASFLESNGYSVTVQSVAETDPDLQVELANQHDVVYIADSIGSTTVHDGVDIFMKDIEVPLISQEAYMWDEAEWTGRDQFLDYGDTFQALDDQVLGAFTELDIVDPDHPLAAGLSGTVTVYDDPYGFSYGFVPNMGPGVNVIATIPGAPEYATLFVYEPGAELAEGTTSAGLRIGMYMGQQIAREEFGGDGLNIRWDRLTEDGRKLVLAAFDYATGRLAPGVPGDFDGNGTLDATDIDELTRQSAAGNNDAAFDLNGDQAVNFMDVEQWIVLFNSWVGDANLDGEFNSSDLVAVLASGTYEAEVSSVWTTGDFNGDGRTNSSDLVAALAGGGYELGPRAAAAAVPEPSTIGLLLTAFIVALRRGMARMARPGGPSV
jgi:hypothetical protein